MSILIHTFARSLGLQIPFSASVCASTQCIPKALLPYYKMKMTEGMQAASPEVERLGGVS